MYKKFFCLFLVLCALLFLFKERAASYLIRYSIASHCKNLGGLDFSYKALLREGKQWKFLAPQLVGNGSVVNANALTVEAFPVWKEWSIHIRLTLDEPVIDLGSTNLRLKQIFLGEEGEDCEKIASLRVQRFVQINKGHLIWRPERSAKKSRDLLFSLKYRQDLCFVEGFVDLQGVKGQNHFVMSFSRAKGATEYASEVTCHRFDLFELFEGYRLLGGNLGQWEVERGFASGKIHFNYTNSEQVEISGRAVLSELKFHEKSLQIRGEVPHLTLAMLKNPKKERGVSAEVDLGADGQLVFGALPLKLSQMKGVLRIESDGQLSAEGAVVGELERDAYPLQIQGTGCIRKKQLADVSVEVAVLGEEEELSSLTFYSPSLNQHHKKLKMTVHQLPISLGHRIFSRLLKFPSHFDGLAFSKGIVEGKCTAKFEGHLLAGVRIEELAASQLEGVYSSLGLKWGVKECTGQLSVDFLSPDVMKSVNGVFEIADGEVEGVEIYGNSLHFEGVKTRLTVRKGVIQNSILKGQFAGMEGKIFAHFGADSHLEYLFEGEVAQIMSHLSPRVCRTLTPFTGDRVTLAGKMQPKGRGVCVYGDLQCQRLNGTGAEMLRFGFVLQKSHREIWRRGRSDPKAVEDWREWGRDAFASVFPPLITFSGAAILDCIDRETEVGGIVVKNGWVAAEGIPLENYLSPFIFSENPRQMQGTGTFSGRFDQKGLAIEYVGEGVTLESGTYGLSCRSHLEGRHFFDFVHGISWGELPFSEGEYVEKISGVAFRSFSGTALFNGKKVTLKGAKTHCQGLELGGEVFIDLSLRKPESFHIEVTVREIVGEVAEILSLFSDFGSEFHADFDLVGGRLIPGPSGITFLLAGSKEGTEVTRWGDFHLDLNRGIRWADSLSLDELRFSMEFDERKDSCQFYDLFARTHLGEEQFFLRGEGKRQDSEGQPLIGIDWTLSDLSSDLARLKGNVSLGAEEVRVEFDSRFTHFDHVAPSQFYLTLDRGYQIKQFCLNTLVELPSLSDFLARWDLLLDDFPVAGNVLVDLRAGSDAVWNTQITGSGLRAGPYQIEQLSVMGKKTGEKWSLTSLEADLFSGALYATFGEKGWKIDRGLFEYGSFLSGEVGGFFSPDLDRFEGDVTHLEINLGNIPPDFSNPFKETLGILSGAGGLTVQKGGEAKKLKVDARLELDVEGLEMGGFIFQKASKVTCHFMSDRGLKVQNFASPMKVYGYKDWMGTLFVPFLEYQFDREQLKVEGASFSLPNQTLPCVAHQLAMSFPALVSEEAGHLIANCKSEGSLAGELRLSQSTTDFEFSLHFKDGEYTWMEYPFLFKRFVVKSHRGDLSMSAICQLGETSCELQVISADAALKNGSIQLSQGEESLQIDWKQDPALDSVITRVAGSLSGVHVDLQRDHSALPITNAAALEGEVRLNGVQARKVLPSLPARLFRQWEIGNGYSFRGKWRIHPGENRIHPFQFFGTLRGRNSEWMGYQFASLDANVEWTHQSIALRDIRLKDPAISLHAARLDSVKKGEDVWEFSCPSLTVSHFKPSALIELGGKTTAVRRAFVIEECVFTGCRGTIGEKLDWTGEGYFRFTNEGRKLHSNTFIQIPAEIITRIGLNPSLLTPTQGEVDFELREDRIWFTRFSGVQSKGKYSKFYLSKDTPSSMGIGGDLDMHVEIKQHKLLLKFAHLFNEVAVEGSAWNPTYSVKKKRKN